MVKEVEWMSHILLAVFPSGLRSILNLPVQVLFYNKYAGSCKMQLYYNGHEAVQKGRTRTREAVLRYAGCCMELDL